MEIPRDVNHLIANASTWLITPEGDIAAYLASGQTIVVSTEMLTQRHHLLPDVIHALCNENTIRKTSLVRSTLAVLENKLILGYSKEDGVIPFWRISDIVYDERKPFAVQVLGQVVFLKHFDTEGPSVPIVVGTQSLRISVDKQYWDTQYKGWLERVNVGESLGLPFQESVSLAFHPGKDEPQHIEQLPEGLEL